MFKKMLIRLNEALTGFRGIIVILAPIGLAYVDAVSANLTGVTLAQVKSAAAFAIVPTLKLAWTDARPKIQSWFAKDSPK